MEPQQKMRRKTQDSDGDADQMRGHVDGVEGQMPLGILWRNDALWHDLPFDREDVTCELSFGIGVSLIP